MHQPSDLAHAARPTNAEMHVDCLHASANKHSHCLSLSLSKLERVAILLLWALGALRAQACGQQSPLEAPLQGWVHWPLRSCHLADEANASALSHESGTAQQRLERSAVLRLLYFFSQGSMLLALHATTRRAHGHALP